MILINQKQVLGLDSVLSNLEDRKESGREYVLKAGDTINGNLDISGTLTASDLLISGRSFLIDSRGYIETNYAESEISSENHIKISNSGDEQVYFTLESSTGDLNRFCLGDDFSFGQEAVGCGDFSFLSKSGFKIDANGATKVFANESGINLLNDLQSNNILIEEIGVFSSVGDTALLDGFYSQEVYLKEYDLILYSAAIATGVELEISEKNNAPNIISYPSGAIQGIKFSVENKAGLFELSIENLLADVWVGGITKSYMRPWVKPIYHSSSSISSESSSSSSHSSASSSLSSLSSSRSSSSVSSLSSVSSSSSISSSSSQSSSSRAYDYEYSEIEGGLRLDRYIGEDLFIDVPNEIYGEPILEIGAGTFSGISFIEGIKVFDGITGIGTRAFSKCSNLYGVDLPRSLVEIKPMAFLMCNSLQNVVIPHVEKIGNAAFYGCPNLSEIYIGSGLKEIEDFAFAGTRPDNMVIPSGLERIGIYSIPLFSGLDSVVFNGDAPEISDESEIIGGGINTRAYYYCGTTGWESTFGGLKTENLCDYMFETGANWASITGYTGLGGDIMLPSNISGIAVSYVEERSFDSNNVITKLRVPKSITGIGYGAFSGIYSLTELNLPNNGIELEDYSFNNCSITHIQIPDSIKYINEGVFAENIGTLEISIGLGVTGIGIEAFFASPIESLYIPNQVVSIEAGAFDSCENLTGVEFGTGISYIGNYAFAFSPLLSSIIFNGNAPELGDDVFIHINEDAVVYYKEDASGFGETFGGIETFCLREYYFYNSGDKAIISSYGGEGGHIVIPDTLGGLEVYGIGSGAFANESGINTVEVNSGIRYIGDYAFSGCSLTGIVFNTSYMNIETGIDIFNGITSGSRVYFYSGIGRPPYYGSCSWNQWGIPTLGFTGGLW